MFSSEQAVLSSKLRPTWRISETQMDHPTYNSKQRYEQILQSAWQNYYQNTQPKVQKNLGRIEKRCDSLAEQIHTGESTSDHYLQERNEIVEELIHTCMQLAQPARRLGNLTGQTNYFYLWKTLWAEVIDQHGEILSEKLQPYLPMLYADWHRDSILKRSFDRVTKKKHRSLR